jgi:hypothetical protein
MYMTHNDRVEVSKPSRVKSIQHLGTLSRTSWGDFSLMRVIEETIVFEW